MTELWPRPDSEWLPPIEVRLINPAEKIPTPTDDRNLIDPQRLTTDVLSTVDPDYTWPKGLSVHHMYWPAANYPYNNKVEVNPAHFRNLAVHKILVPRVFENWLHKITEEPPVPDPEVMHYRVEAWKVAKELFKTARGTVQWRRMAERRRIRLALDPTILRAEFNGEDVEGEQVMQTIFERNFRTLERQLRRQERIPAEFRLINSESSPESIAKTLGKLIVPGSLNFSRLAS